MISNMIRNNWNGSADPTIRSSSALYRELKSNAPNRFCRTSCITMNSMFVDCAWCPVSRMTFARSPSARQCSSEVPQSGTSIV